MVNQRLVSTLKKYGIVGYITHMSLSISSMGFWYVAVKTGFDVSTVSNTVHSWVSPELLKVFPGADELLKGPTSSGMVESAGAFAAAYAIHKLTMPLRLPVTIIFTPVVARNLPARIKRLLEIPK